MELAREDIAAAVASIVAGYDVRAVYLFGSFARGDQELGSDVDLRFACGPAMDYGALYRLSQQLEGALGRSVEIVTNPPRFMRSAFRERVQHDEVLLYGSLSAIDLVQVILGGCAGACVAYSQVRHDRG